MVVVRLYAPLVALSLAVLSLSPASWGDEGRVFYAEDIKAAMAEHIESRIDEAGRFFWSMMKRASASPCASSKFTILCASLRIGATARVQDFAVDGARQLYDLDFFVPDRGSA